MPERRTEGPRRQLSFSSFDSFFHVLSFPLSLSITILFASITLASASTGYHGPTGATERVEVLWRCHRQRRCAIITHSYSPLSFSLFDQTITAGARLRFGKLKGSIH